MRSVPLGQSAAQRLLGRLAAEMPGVVGGALALAAAPDAAGLRQAHVPMLAVLSAQHETQYSRLFRSRIKSHPPVKPGRKSVGPVLASERRALQFRSRLLPTGQQSARERLVRASRQQSRVLFAAQYGNGVGV